MVTVAKVGLVSNAFKACSVKDQFLSDNYLQSKKEKNQREKKSWFEMWKWGITRNDERLQWCLAFCCQRFAVIISLPSVSACQSEWLICWSRLRWKHRPFCSSEMITSKKASFCGMFLSQGLIPDCALLQNTVSCLAVDWTHRQQGSIFNWNGSTLVRNELHGSLQGFFFFFSCALH